MLLPTPYLSQLAWGKQGGRGCCPWDKTTNMSFMPRPHMEVIADLVQALLTTRMACRALTVPFSQLIQKYGIAFPLQATAKAIDARVEPNQHLMGLSNENDMNYVPLPRPSFSIRASFLLPPRTTLPSKSTLPPPACAPNPAMDEQGQVFGLTRGLARVERMGAEASRRPRGGQALGIPYGP